MARHGRSVRAAAPIISQQVAGSDLIRRPQYHLFGGQYAVLDQTPNAVAIDAEFGCGLRHGQRQTGDRFPKPDRRVVQRLCAGNTCFRRARVARCEEARLLVDMYCFQRPRAGRAEDRRQLVRPRALRATGKFSSRATTCVTTHPSVEPIYWSGVECRNARSYGTRSRSPSSGL